MKSNFPSFLNCNMEETRKVGRSKNNNNIESNGDVVITRNRIRPRGLC